MVANNGKHPCDLCGKTELDLHKNLVDVVKCSDDTFGDVLKLNVHVKEMQICGK